MPVFAKGRSEKRFYKLIDLIAERRSITQDRQVKFTDVVEGIIESMYDKAPLEAKFEVEGKEFLLIGARLFDFISSRDGIDSIKSSLPELVEIDCDYPLVASDLTKVIAGAAVGHNSLLS